MTSTVSTVVFQYPMNLRSSHWTLRKTCRKILLPAAEAVVVSF